MLTLLKIHNILMPMSYSKNSIDGIARGVKVRFTGTGGWPEQNAIANKRLQIDEVYKVSYVEVHSWSSNVYLEGYEGCFNSVMFEVVNIDFEVN